MVLPPLRIARLFLLSKSVKFYEPVIECIANLDSAIWEIDVDRYTDLNIDLVLGCKHLKPEAGSISPSQQRILQHKAEAPR